MFSFARDVFLYVLFLILLTIVCYGNRSYHGYLITQNLEDTFSNFVLAQDPRHYWNWLGGQFVGGIYANEWYNGEKATKQEYINNKKSILLGMPRLRQLRVKKDSCAVPEKARDMIRHCNDYYSFDDEDKTPFNLPGWEPFGGSTSWANFSDLCPAPWNYVPQHQVHDSPSWGFFDVYSGGGYVADLGYNKSTASPLISNLRKFGWIDRQTRAVLLEFAIYNPNTGYLSISTFYYEILPFGYGKPFARIHTFPLTRTQTGFYQFYLNCQFLFIIMVIMFVLREVYNIYRMRWSYFTDAWNWVEILQIIFSFLVVVFNVMKSKVVLNSALKVKENPFVPVNFQDAVLWNDAENVVIAIAVFITTLKLLRMIRFNPHVSMLISSFRKSRGLLLSYSVIFVIIFFAYAQLGTLVLGSNVQQYSSFQNALIAEFLMCLGSNMRLGDLMQVNRILGPLFGFSFVLLNAFVFVNFFVAILNDSYQEIQTNPDKQSKEFQMADFILDRLTELFGFGKNQRNDESSSESEERKLEQEVNEKPNTTFSNIAFQSHRLRHKARKIQSRHAGKLQKKVTEEKKQPKDQFNAGTSQISTAHESITERKKYHLKSAVSGIMASIYLHQINALKELDSLAGKLARDDVREDFEILSLIRLLRTTDLEDTEDIGDTKDTEDIISQTDATLLVTGGHLPEHLRRKIQQQKLRAALRKKQELINRPKWRP